MMKLIEFRDGSMNNFVDAYVSSKWMIVDEWWIDIQHENYLEIHGNNAFASLEKYYPQGSMDWLL